MKKLNSFLNIMLVLLFCMTLEIPMPAKAANGGQYVPVYLNGSMIVNGGVASDLPDSKVGEKTGKGNKYVPDPNGSFSLNSNADQMSTDVFSYNMFRCFGSGTGDNAVPIDGFSYSGGNSSRRMVNYGAENEADSDGTYSITIRLLRLWHLREIFNFLFQVLLFQDTKIIRGLPMTTADVRYGFI